MTKAIQRFLPLLLIVLVSATLAAATLVWLSVLASHHEEFLARVHSRLGPPCAIKPLLDEELNTVERQWVRSPNDGSGVAEALALLRMDPTLASVVRFMNYRAPKFSWMDMSKNKRNILFTTLQGIVPEAKDQAIYESQDRRKLLIYSKEGTLAFVYEQRDNQIVEAWYVRPNEEIEPGVGADSR